MSRSFLTRLPEEIHNHFTFVRKIWLTVLIFFQIVLTAVEGESIFYDEQSKFVCNTEQPGCENVCDDALAPLSHMCFCVFQIILVATPSVIYLGYVIHKVAKMEHSEADKKADLSKAYAMHWKQHWAQEETEEDHEEDPMMYPEMELEGEKGNKDQNQSKPMHDGQRQIREDGLKLYLLQLLARTAFEVGFLIGQYFLYGFQVHPFYVCSRLPCPHKIDCFISRPTEKTIFLLIMYGVKGLCLLLNIWEMLHLGCGTIGDSLNNKRRELEDPAAYNYPFTWNTPSPPGYNIAIKPDQTQYTELSSNTKIATSKIRQTSPRNNSTAAMKTTSQLTWRLCRGKSKWLRNAWIWQSRPTITKITPMVPGKKRPKWGPKLGPTKAVLVANQGMGRPPSEFNLGWA